MHCLKFFQGLPVALKIKSKLDTLAFKTLNNLALASSAFHVNLFFTSIRALAFPDALIST
jgi:hypothetical protein